MDGDSGGIIKMGISDESINAARGVMGQIYRELAYSKGRVLICGCSGDSGAQFLAGSGLEVHRERPGKRGDFSGIFTRENLGSDLRRPEGQTGGASTMYGAAVVVVGEDEYLALPLAFFAGLRRTVRPGGLIGIVVTGTDTGNSRPNRAQLLVAFEGCSIEYARTESEAQNEWSVIFRKPTALV